MDTNKMLKVKNRSAGIVVFSIPEINVRREFAPSEEKNIAFKELEQLSYQSGGKELIQNYLQITDTEVIDELNIKTEPEYFLTEAEIKELVTTGSIESFLDCLDFAPEGVINLIKKIAVELPMTDTQKRRALKAKTGFDVDAAVRNSEPEDVDNTILKGAAQRRVQPEEESTVRRTAPKYNVVHRGDNQ